MANNNRKYPLSDVKVLYGRAAGRCAIASCRKILVLENVPGDRPKQIGQIAHIIAHSQNGPRGDATYPQNLIDTYANWVLLCPTCHDIVDARPAVYSKEVLRQIKQEHEFWVEASFDQAMSNVTFTELEIAAKAMASGIHVDDSDFHVISPDEKISKNGLTNLSRVYIIMGLSRSAEVGRFLTKMAMLDPEFPERLKSGFKKKYMELKLSTSGDALFMSMLNFASQGLENITEQAAALAILVHLFHLCEVFEK